MKRLVVGIAITLGAVLGLLTVSAQAAKPDTEAVSKATQQFYSALNVLFTGSSVPMEDAWSHAADITYMGPAGGLRSGWSQIQAEWKVQASLKLGGKVEPKDLHMTVGRDLAIVSNYEVGENVGPDGQSQKVEIRATNLFRKEQGKWKMIGHHTDLLPFLQK